LRGQSRSMRLRMRRLGFYLLALVCVGAEVGAAPNKPATQAPAGRSQSKSGAQARPRTAYHSVSLLRLKPAIEEHLKIRPDQKTQIEAIVARFREDSRRATTETRTDRRAATARVKALFRQADADAEAVLSDDQKKKLETLRKDTDRFRFMGRVGPGLACVPDLTDEQRDKLESLGTRIMHSRRELLRELRNPASKPQAIQDVQALDQKMLSGIKGILSPAQWSAYQRAGVSNRQ
jgi:hypothetical protein